MGNRTKGKFQFHNGTIKTFSKSAEKKVNISFNSITVQLRRRNGKISLAWNCSFNSITVQLRPSEETNKKILKTRFNSITVQLRLS